MGVTPTRQRAAIATLAVALLGSCGGSSGFSSGESDGPAWNAARTSSDGTSIVLVFTGGQEYDPSNPCSLDYRADVTETAESVTIGLISVRSQAPSDDEVMCAALGYPRRLEVPLTAPLGERSLIEQHSGTAQPAFDGSQLLEPGWLPEGWLLGGEGVAYPLADTSQVWVRGWGAPSADPWACVPSFSVVQGAPVAVQQLPEEMGGGPVVGSYDVNGHTAVHTRNTERLLERFAWTVGDVAVAVLATTCGPEPVDTDSVLRFARALA